MVGLGKDLVALGAMRNVDAGARTFFNSGFGILVVCSIGSAVNQQGLIYQVISPTYVGQEPCTWNVEFEETVSELE